MLTEVPADIELPPPPAPGATPSDAPGYTGASSAGMPTWALPGTPDPTPAGWTVVAPTESTVSAPPAGSTPAASRADRGRDGRIGTSGLALGRWRILAGDFLYDIDVTEAQGAFVDVNSIRPSGRRENRQ